MVPILGKQMILFPFSLVSSIIRENCLTYDINSIMISSLSCFPSGFKHGSKGLLISSYLWANTRDNKYWKGKADTKQLSHMPYGSEEKKMYTNILE